MQSSSKARKLVSISSFQRMLNPNRSVDAPHYAVHQWRSHITLLLSRLLSSSSGIGGYADSLNHRSSSHLMLLPMVGRASSFCSDATTSIESSSTEPTEKESSSTEETAKEVYDKMMVSITGRTCPPNAWLRSLIKKCQNSDDIKLLFDLLHKLRLFRLSSLRISANYNECLCREITKACVRAGALDFGKQTLWKHNVYGLTPTIGCAHDLLRHARKHNDISLMVDIIKLVQKNDLPLKTRTADIVFSICGNTNNWELYTKYSEMFVKAGVKLREPSFDLWMDSAAKIGDTISLWKIEKLRNQTMKYHTIATGIACAKGFLLEHKPDKATSVLLDLYQGLSDAKKPQIVAPLEELVSEWSLEVIKHKKEDDRKELIASLTNDIPAMVSGLLNAGLDFNVDMEELNKQKALLT